MPPPANDDEWRCFDYDRFNDRISAWMIIIRDIHHYARGSVEALEND